MNSANAKRPFLALLLALALGSPLANADTNATTSIPAPAIDIEVWDAAGAGWKAKLNSSGSQIGTWNNTSWNWNPVTSGALFDINATTGQWSLMENWQWAGPGFSVDVSAGGNLDPYISYGMTAFNGSAGALTFQHIVTAPILPTVSGPSLVRASLSGAMTDGTGNGVNLTAAPNRTQDGNFGDEVQLFLLGNTQDFTTPGAYVNAGVDVGGNASYTGAGSTTYGTFSDGFTAGPAGTWNYMQTRTRFTLTGNNDVAVMAGFAEIVPIPEPETYAMLLAGLGLLGFMRSRRRT